MIELKQKPSVRWKLKEIICTNCKTQAQFAQGVPAILR